MAETNSVLRRLRNLLLRRTRIAEVAVGEKPKLKSKSKKRKTKRK